MTAAAADWARVSAALDEIRRDLARLGDRVAALERAAGPARPTPAPVPTPAAAPAAGPSPGLDEETVAVISAAVAAFLGVKPRIRQIRLIGTTAWAQQGRVTIQASHAAGRHARSQP